MGLLPRPPIEVVGGRAAVSPYPAEDAAPGENPNRVSSLSPPAIRHCRQYQIRIRADRKRTNESRSAERSVGPACVSKCRSRLWTYHYNKCSMLSNLHLINAIYIHSRSQSHTKSSII